MGTERSQHPPVGASHPGRTAQALSRTAVMHDAGKSDVGVVPQKPSNNPAPAAGAEMVEGRPATNGNLIQPPATEALYPATTLSGLERVRQAARKERKLRFTSLFHHLTPALLAESAISFLATADQAPSLRRTFPRCLGRAPLLLPADGSQMRHELNQWFAQQGMKPLVVGEFVDSALLKVFAESGVGICPVPSIMEDEAIARYRMVSIGRLERLRVRFYAIAQERRVTHPAVSAIIAAARARRRR